MRVEALARRGLQSLSLTGLPDSWLRDSRDKIMTLVQQRSQWAPTQKLLIHLLPADCTKHGSSLELPIALACLAALDPKRVNFKALERYSFAGALGLYGQIVPASSSLGLGREGDQLGPEHFESLDEAWNFICQDAPAPSRKFQVTRPAPAHRFRCCIGRSVERTLLMGCAVAELPVFLMGKPGVGKTHLVHWAAERLPLPQGVAFEQVQAIWSLASDQAPQLPVIEAMARAHLADFTGRSRAGVSRPGYFSLAHGGALIVDEFLELNRDARESFRTVLDSGELLRPSHQRLQRWPTRFWFLATSNPCPCGLSGFDSWAECRCRPQDRWAYRSRLSGPLADRFGVLLWIREDSPTPSALEVPSWIDDEPDALRIRIERARARMKETRPIESPKRRRILQERLRAAFEALEIEDAAGWVDWAEQERIQLQSQSLN